VEFTGANTFFGKTATLLQKNSNERTHLQRMLMTIMYVLVGLSTTLCTLSLLYLLSRGEDFKQSLTFIIVILVASIPLAIEIVTTTTLAIGSKTLARHGAIVTKLSAIEDLAGMSILCSDKTGTLTLNEMVLQDDTPVYISGETQSSVLVYASMAAKWNEPPRDALDRLTLGSVDMKQLQSYEQLEYVPFDPQIKRTEGTVRHGETGVQFKTSKGAPHIILDLLPAKSAEVRIQVEMDVARFGENGIRSLAVAKTNPSTKEWQMVGLLTFLDPPRPDTKETIQHTRDLGVQVKMITGTENFARTSFCGSMPN
jgi:H+-transporting ATPase